MKLGLPEKCPAIYREGGQASALATGGAAEAQAENAEEKDEEEPQEDSDDSCDDDDDGADGREEKQESGGIDIGAAAGDQV